MCGSYCVSLFARRRFCPRRKHSTYRRSSAMSENAIDGPDLGAFRDHLDRGKLASLATFDGERLSMCSCWYALSDDRRSLIFTSRENRDHSVNIRANGLVSGSIIAIELEGLGQKTQGVFLKGTAIECEGNGARR